MQKIISATPLPEFRLLVTYASGEQRVGSIAPLLEKPVFAFLRDPAAFSRVYLSYGALTWRNAAGDEVDICPDKFYQDSKPV